MWLLWGPNVVIIPLSADPLHSTYLVSRDVHLQFLYLFCIRSREILAGCCLRMVLSLHYRVHKSHRNKPLRHHTWRNEFLTFVQNLRCCVSRQFSNTGHDVYLLSILLRSTWEKKTWVWRHKVFSYVAGESTNHPWHAFQGLDRAWGKRERGYLT